MNYNTQNAKIASITEKTLIIGIDVGSETIARALAKQLEYLQPFASVTMKLICSIQRRGLRSIAEKHGMGRNIPE